jgi:LPXTG-motif cell wall-anchored protein
MRSAHSLSRLAIGMCLLALTAAAATAQTTKTTETKHFTVVGVDGNKAIVRGDNGATQEVTVTDDYRFTVDGQQVTVHQLKPGMKGTALITTTTTVKPVHVTEVRNGEVLQASGASIIIRGPNGIKMFSQGDIDKRGITLIKNGEPADISQFHTGDRLTATIVTEGTPKTMTSRQVQAALQSGGSTPAASPGTASTSGGGAAPPRVASSSTASGSTTTAAGGSGRKLPKTASELPLIGLVGAGLLAAGTLLSALRKRRES